MIINKFKILYSEKMKSFLQCLIFLLISIFSFGQIGLGQWRDHYCYIDGKKVVFANNDVYLQTAISLLKYDLKSNEIETISKIQGLNDAKIGTIEFSQKHNTLVIGYMNGNIDLIQNNKIININDIQRKPIMSEKSINTIAFENNFAYLGCSFGIVVLDLVKKEIKDTWYIGNNGGFLKINKIIVSNSIIYVATDIGIYKGNLELHSKGFTNLADFANWEIITNNNYGNTRYDWLKDKCFNNMVYFQNKLIVSYYSAAIKSDSILIFDKNGWSNFETYKYFGEVFDISCNENNLIIVTWWGLCILDKNYQKIKEKYLIDIPSGTVDLRPINAVFNPNDTNIFAIADKKNGLFIVEMQNWNNSQISYNYPIAYNVYNMDAFGDDIFCVPGAHGSSGAPGYKQPMVYSFVNQRWSSISSANNPEISPASDFVSIVADRNDKSHLFVASWTKGLFEFRNNKFVQKYDSVNSTLEHLYSMPNQLRINSLKYDNNGNLWMSNSLTSKQFHVLDRNNKWHSFKYPSIGGDYNYLDMIITQDNTKWVIARANGIVVFNENGTFDDISDDKYLKLSIRNEVGEFLNNNVWSIAEDKDGYIWVGTEAGVVVYYNPQDVFKTNITARQIKVPRNNGTNEADLLLETEAVTTIAVDGANNKWFGTRSSGVYCVSPDGLQQIYHFTTDNSPLPDNSIICIKIAPSSGEVFIATDLGLISYRHTATEPEEIFSDVYSFPNPVPPDYDGLIAIKGLMENSYVKITDISGNLVYETRSEGGQATWTGKNGRGKRVATGVYLVFITNSDGTKSTVTKILFIN